MKTKNLLFTIFAGIILTLFIFSASVVLSLNCRPLYYLDMQLLQLSEETGLPDSEIKANYDVLIDYNQFYYTKDLKFPTLAMSDSGHEHFIETKRIFVFFEYLFLGTLVLSILLCIFMHKKKQYGALKLTSILTLVIPIILGLLVAFGWETFFVTFHKLVFQNDYWLFDPATDPVITILPDAYFMHAAILILLLIIAGSLLCHLCYKRSSSST